MWQNSSTWRSHLVFYNCHPGSTGNMNPVSLHMISSLPTGERKSRECSWTSEGDQLFHSRDRQEKSCTEQQLWDWQLAKRHKGQHLQTPRFDISEMDVRMLPQYATTRSTRIDFRPSSHPRSTSPGDKHLDHLPQQIVFSVTCFWTLTSFLFRSS